MSRYLINEQCSQQYLRSRIKEINYIFVEEYLSTINFDPPMQALHENDAVRFGHDNYE